MKPFFYDMDYVKSQSKKNLFSVVSMFAGAGGSSTGYRLAGGKVLAVNEFIQEARDTYSENYPDTKILPGDIRSISGADILSEIGMRAGELDILDGSPPCASFSIAGAKDKMWGEVKKYSDTEQRTDDLFFEFARILNDIQPKVFVCENVKGLTMGQSSTMLGSSQYNIFESQEDTILHTLTRCGYKVRYKVLNARNFGVPQNRERIIFIGVRNDIDAVASFPIGSSDFVSLGEALNTDVVIRMNDEFFQNNVVFEMTKSGNVFKASDRRVKHSLVHNVVRHGVNVSQKDRHKPADEIFVDSYNSVSPTILTAYKGLANGLVECVDGDGNSILRKLTIPELKVVCSFPYDYALTGTYSKQWERLGRAVPPLMMKAVAEHIYENILKGINY